MRQLWLANAAWGCSEAVAALPVAGGSVASAQQHLGALATLDNSPPVLLLLSAVAENGGTGVVGEAFVGQGITLSAAVADPEGDSLRLRLTVFGLPPRCACAHGVLLTRRMRRRPAYCHWKSSDAWRPGMACGVSHWVFALSCPAATAGSPTAATMWWRSPAWARCPSTTRSPFRCRCPQAGANASKHRRRHM